MKDGSCKRLIDSLDGAVYAAWQAWSIGRYCEPIASATFGGSHWVRKRVRPPLDAEQGFGVIQLALSRDAIFAREFSLSPGRTGSRIRAVMQNAIPLASGRTEGGSGLARVAAVAGKPKLLDQLRAALRSRHYSLRTEQGIAGPQRGTP